MKPRIAGAFAVTALVALAATAPATVAAGGGGHRARAVSGVTTGNDSELVPTIPITRGSLGAPRSAISLAPGRLPRLRRGDRLVVSAEVEVTTTCVDASGRCVGRPYPFTPTVGARLVLANGKHVARGPHALALSKRQTLRCHQQRPNRNHHCVFVFPRTTKRLGHPGRLPCHLRHCHVNLVLDAHHPAAQGGNVLVVGADRPDGSVKQDMGRVNAVVIPRGVRPQKTRTRTRHHLRRSIPMGAEGSDGELAIYSVPVHNLRRGDVLVVQAREVTGIGALPYSAFVSSEVIFTGRRRATRPSRRSAARQGGYVTEANGFNCTQGPSAFQTPCVTRKTGVVAIKHNVVNRHGKPRTVYVNLLTRSFPKLAHARPGDAARIEKGGFLSVVRYRSP